MDKTVFYDFSYGMYAIGAIDGGRTKGCIVNTVTQVTSQNPVIAVSINKDNYTYDVIKRSGKFTVSVLSEQVNPNVIAELGFTSGRDGDKLTGAKYELYDGMPVVKCGVCGYASCEVIGMQETETHFVILARVCGTQKGDVGYPMTYKYYHDVIKGKAPKNAPTYRGDVPEAHQYSCLMCGYVYEGDDFESLPDDYVCPICGSPKEAFKLRD